MIRKTIRKPTLISLEVDPLRELQGAQEEPEGRPGGPGDLKQARGVPGLPSGSSPGSPELPQGIYFEGDEGMPVSHWSLRTNKLVIRGSEEGTIDGTLGPRTGPALRALGP